MYLDRELGVVLICQSVSLGMQLALATVFIAELVIPLTCPFSWLISLPGGLFGGDLIVIPEPIHSTIAKTFARV